METAQKLAEGSRTSTKLGIFIHNYVIDFQIRRASNTGKFPIEFPTKLYSLCLRTPEIEGCSARLAEKLLISELGDFLRADLLLDIDCRNADSDLDFVPIGYKNIAGAAFLRGGFVRGHVSNPIGEDYDNFEQFKEAVGRYFHIVNTVGRAFDEKAISFDDTIQLIRHSDLPDVFKEKIRLFWQH